MPGTKVWLGSTTWGKGHMQGRLVTKLSGVGDGWQLVWRGWVI